jgi:hypothetical protein
MPTKAETIRAEQAEALDELRAALPPGSTVSTIVRHVTSSGMSRSISPVICSDGRPWDLTYLAVRAGAGSGFDQRNGGVRMGGCGMDMGFALVYELARKMYPDGFPCTGDRCPSNDHSNGDRDYTPGHVVHRDGGYAISQTWL